jgi:hypothetical protein
MSGWNTRIQIRNDQAGAWSPENEPVVDTGELAASIDGDSVEIRVGMRPGMSFDLAPRLAAGEPDTQPLAIDSGSTSSGAGTLWWDGSQWQPDGTPIIWSISSATGAVQYTAATDSWSTNASVTIITDADGGLFTGSFTAPAFSPSYDPTIGEPS